MHPVARLLVPAIVAIGLLLAPAGASATATPEEVTTAMNKGSQRRAQLVRRGRRCGRLAGGRSCRDRP
jgi:hypothetical protein